MLTHFPVAHPPGVNRSDGLYWRKSSILARYMRKWIELKLELTRLFNSFWLPTKFEGVRVNWAHRQTMKAGVTVRCGLGLAGFGVLALIVALNFLALNIFVVGAAVGFFGYITVAVLSRRYFSYKLTVGGPGSTAIFLQYSADQVLWGFHWPEASTDRWKFKSQYEFPLDDVSAWWDAQGCSPLTALLAAQELEQLMLTHASKVTVFRSKKHA